MAKIVEEVILGIDVSQQSLDIFGSGPDQVLSIANNEQAIRDFLNALVGPVVVSVEATNDYHETLVDIALDLGFQVYLIDGYRLSKYREAVGVRAKTDQEDARLLYRFLISERASLRPFVGGNKQERLLWRLLKRRAKVVKLRIQLESSLSGIDVLATEKKAMRATFNRFIEQLTQRAHELAKRLGWWGTLQRLRTIPGVGELSALGLLAMYRRGKFSSADQFIAFLGLDVRVRDSGKYRGRRKLTKRGDPEIRRLLFNGARSVAASQADWAAMKTHHLARGMSEIQSSVILARKLARIAFAILRDGSTYRASEPVGTSG